MSSKTGIAQLQTWEREDGIELRLMALRKRWSAWRTAYNWLEEEVVSKIESAMNMVRELDQGRADDMSKWLDVGRTLHALVSSVVRFSSSSKELMERLIAMVPQGEDTNSLLRRKESEKYGDDDLDKNALFSWLRGQAVHTNCKRWKIKASVQTTRNCVKINGFISQKKKKKRAGRRATSFLAKGWRPLRSRVVSTKSVLRLKHRLFTRFTG